jgi:hypothetical protein
MTSFFAPSLDLLFNRLETHYKLLLLIIAAIGWHRVPYSLRRIIHISFFKQAIPDPQAFHHVARFGLLIVLARYAQSFLSQRGREINGYGNTKDVKRCHDCTSILHWSALQKARSG